MELCTKRKSATTSWRSLWKWLVTCKRSSAHRRSASASRSASSRAAPWCTPYAAASHICCSTLWQIPMIFQWCPRVVRYRSPLAEVQNSRIHGEIGTSSSLSNRDRTCARLYLPTRYIDRHHRRMDGAKTEIGFRNFLLNLRSIPLALISDGFLGGRFLHENQLKLLQNTRRNVDVIKNWF